MDSSNFDDTMAAQGSHNGDDSRNDVARLLPDEPMMEDDHRALDEEGAADHNHMLPPLPERTLKERLVERERQARVETERARLKRQFALSNGGAGDAQSGDFFVEEEESVAGTVGAGSSVAAAPTEYEPPKDDDQDLGYAMERFLSEKNAVSNGSESILAPPDGAGGVVMERFLSEPVVVAPAQDTTSHHSIDGDVDDVPSPSIAIGIGTGIHRGEGAFLVDQLSHHSELGTTAGSIRSYSPVSESDIAVANDDRESLENLDYTLTEDGHHSQFGSSREPGSPLQSAFSYSQQSDQPRLFRLTEREIQEMAAIEEASIGNAPPSEREDEFSEVGDLVDHFQEDMEHRHDIPFFSERTQTTASFSNTIQSHDGIESTSDASHLVLSPGATSEASVISVTANPPSEIAPEESTPLIPDNNMGDSPGGAQLGHFVDDERPLDVMVSVAINKGVINRRIRPGMIMTPPRGRTSPENRREELKRSISMPVIVDGFDYDKFDTGIQYTYSAEQDSDLPGDELWSPSSAMNISPLHDRKMAAVAASPQQKNVPFLDNDEEVGSERETLDSRYHVKYGSISQDRAGMLSRGAYQEDSQTSIETAPLVETNEKITSRTNGGGRPRARPFLEAAESVFSSLRSNDPEDVEEESNDSEKYRRSSVVARAFPERQIALMVTLLVEIPVLLMVSGGSDRLCSVIGRKKYQLMMGFLPLSSAISGNCGLQASTLTTRAISHDHVTLDNYASWLRAEVGAALFLGLGMGFVLGTCAFFMSGLDIVFALTIFMAQFVSVVTAGLTGTLAPLLFTFIFRRDSGKWGGPLETAIQDIVGSFAMVVMSYQLLVLFGPRELDPSDVCGAVSV
jgi:hypothetical protein